MKNSLAIAYAMKRKSKKMANGGMMEDEARRKAQYSIDGSEAHIMSPMTPEESDKRMNEYEDHSDDSLIHRIMRKRNAMAHGGIIADEGMGEPSSHPDQSLADYDYLSSGDLDDSSTNSGAADGDFLGNSQEDEDRKDMVKKIMRQRSMKQSNPRPA